MNKLSTTLCQTRRRESGLIEGANPVFMASLDDFRAHLHISVVQVLLVSRYGKTSGKAHDQPLF
jgi:hypothetical protein